MNNCQVTQLECLLSHVLQREKRPCWVREIRDREASVYWFSTTCQTLEHNRYMWDLTSHAQCHQQVENTLEFRSKLDILCCFFFGLHYLNTSVGSVFWDIAGKLSKLWPERGMYRNAMVKMGSRRNILVRNSWVKDRNQKGCWRNKKQFSLTRPEPLEEWWEYRLEREASNIL